MGISLTRAATLAVPLLTLFAYNMCAQSTTSLRGTVVDPTKAIIATAKVTINDIELGQTRSAVTNSSGEFQFAQLRPGTYTLTVESSGFSSRRFENIKLLVDTPATLDIKLELATSAATVDVVAEVPQLNTVDASIGNAFEEKKIQSLPLQTRNVAQLLSLQPGVTQNGEVMGARRDQNNISLDGIDANDNQNPLSGLNNNDNGAQAAPKTTPGTAVHGGFNTALPVPLDSVQEFRVTVAGQGAYDGRSSGGQVSLVTRSGSNVLHGSAYEYNRNTAYTANNWFNNRSGLARPQLIRNQFGASLGGPVKKDRVFYFLNYERRLDSSAATQSRLVPSETLKQGIIRFATSDGKIQQLNPSDIAAIDPQHLGVQSSMLTYLKQFPAGNNPAAGSDAGLNFSGLLFNAPVKLDYRTYVGKFDWLVSSRHSVSFRGTLSNNGETNAAAQFPGQTSASTLLSDNRGFGIRYTATLTPSLTNTANLGLTRIGYGQTGADGPSLTFGALSSLQNFTRGTGRINPTWNFTDDVNWLKGAHTVTAGVNVRWIDNRLLSYSSSYPSYSFGRGTLAGLGQDIYSSALAYVAGGNSALKLNNSTAVTNAFGDLLGLLNGVSVTYQYQKDGSILPIGQPRQTDFVTHNYEFYVQDAWKITPKVTVNYGIRYSYNTPPYEVNGLQVGTTPGLDQYFANRVGAAANGIPGNALPNGDYLTYGLNGPVNGKSSWYAPDKNNWAPRISLAYSPGRNTVFRAGAALTYDQYGNDLVANVASLGSVGLSTALSAPVSYDFSNSPRYIGGAVPTLPTAPQGGFPFTPPKIAAISGTYYGISPDLKAPYSYLLNASLSHQFAGKYTVDVGYVGRLSHKTLVQQDFYTPLLYFKDPKSGTTLQQTNSSMKTLSGSVTAAQAQANPALVPNSQFVENMFPSLANYYFKGSASANYFYGIYGKYAGSDMDLLHILDRTSPSGQSNCFTATGCYTFFAPQGSAMPTWTNAGFANYNSAIITVRRALSSGFAFDFNYTLAHSIDNSSSSASGGGQFGGILQNAFLPGVSRASSDFDIRHLVNANFVYELPFGRGKRMFSSASKLVDEVIGGWQVSSLIRVQSGLPAAVSGSGIYNTNYWNSAPAALVGAAPEMGRFYDEKGNPSIFKGTNTASLFQDAYPGAGGTRNIIRAPWNKNVDIAVQKNFALPFEHHSLELRGEAFNAFNNVNYYGLSLSIANPGTFGEFSGATDARVLQLALRYRF